MYVLIFFHVILHVCNGFKQWYYTGEQTNNVVTEPRFSGHEMDIFSVFNPIDDTSINDLNAMDLNVNLLYFGGALIKLISINSTIDQNTNETIYELLSSEATPTLIHGLHVMSRKVIYYDLLHVVDYGSPNLTSTSVEVGLFDHDEDIFVQRFWRDVKHGQIVAVISDTKSIYFDQHSNEKIRFQRHWTIWSMDHRQRRSLIMHTWEDIDENLFLSPLRTNKPSSGLAGTVKDMEVSTELNEVRTFRIMTYNLWHNNPPSWTYHDIRERWLRYERRLRHFADVVVESDPHCLMLQEVRVDTEFVNQTLSPPGPPLDAGGQLGHLLRHLREARRRRNMSATPYHAAFQPAMSLFDMKRSRFFAAEGVAILCKSPLLQLERLLLPRQLNDTRDDHQRVSLRARVRLASGLHADIVTTHLSLSEQARLDSVSAIRQQLLRAASRPLDGKLLQVAGGDLNAEPEEAAVRLLEADAQEPLRLTDLWRESRRLLRERKQEDGWDDVGFTFPVHSPEKRIDFLFLRTDLIDPSDRPCNCSSLASAEIEAVFLTGASPSPDTAHLHRSRAGLGLLDADSPVWASDHRALVADLLLDSAAGS